MARSATPTVSINELWHSDDQQKWNAALARYWDFVKNKNLELERSLDKLELDRIRNMDADGWYRFLNDEYFVWKYTDPRWLARNKKQLMRYKSDNALNDLDAIRKQLLTLDLEDIQTALKTVCQIRGLGTAGGSGLLSLMYPAKFATVDQFVVKALRGVDEFSSVDALKKIKPDGLSIKDGVFLTRLLGDKTRRLNNTFSSSNWTPRKLEMVLWTYGRD